MEREDREREAGPELNGNLESRFGAAIITAVITHIGRL